MDSDGSRLLFQIPVYRLTFDAWVEAEDKLAEPHVTAMSRTRPIDEARSFASRIVRWQEWEYNEVLGWIEIVGFHDVVKVYLHFRKGERFHRHPTGPFEQLYKMTEVWVEGMTNKQIFGELRDSIVENWRTDRRLAHRHVDLRTFDKLSPHLDWRSLLGVRIGIHRRSPVGRDLLKERCLAVGRRSPDRKEANALRQVGGRPHARCGECTGRAHHVWRRHCMVSRNLPTSSSGNHSSSHHRAHG